MPVLSSCQPSAKTWLKKSLLVGLSTVLVAGCSSSPTGRSQLKLFPTAEVSQMGIQSFAQMKEETPATADPRKTNYVSCVANQVIAQVPAKYGISEWEIVVFESEQVNAFALPGGKVGVYTGLLNVASNQHQLAAVIGHELAHVLAEHGNERISTNYATQTGLSLAYKISGEDSPEKDQLFALLGVGAQVGVILPFGRTQESEADMMGLDLMAQAGFDPKESVTLWQNMAKAGGGAQPEFMSTHPSHERRINDLNGRMSTAVPFYQQAQAAGRKPQCTL